MLSNRRRAAGLAAAALVIAACSPAPSAAPGSPSAAPEGTLAPPSAAASPAASRASDAEVYALIRNQVSAIRGLEPTADVEPVTIDEAQLIENLRAEMDAEQSPKEIALSEDLLETLGLIPAGSSLREETLDLLAGQVIGYYSPDRDELFVVSRSGRAVGALERATYAHEFTHQLQDQAFDLASVDTSALDQSDRAIAGLSLIEGDAAAVQTQWMLEQLTTEELFELIQAAADPDAMAALTNAPAYLRETSIFPYDLRGGLGLVQAILAGGGFRAVDAAFADPPASTEQVIHPEKYLQREDPIDVEIPDDLAGRLGVGWSEAVRDTLGELILRIWLEEHGVGEPRSGILEPPSQAVQEAVAGWGGDRLVLLRHEDGSLAVAMSTTWDTAADAAEFAASAETALADPGFDGELFHRAGSRDVLVAVGDQPAAVLAALRG